MNPHAHIRSLPQGIWKDPFTALGAFASFGAALQEAA